MQYCSLQHQTLLLSPITSTTGYCFCFGSIPSFFLELFLHLSPVAYWAPTDLGSSSFSILSFCLFILFMGAACKESDKQSWYRIKRSIFGTVPPFSVGEYTKLTLLKHPLLILPGAHVWPPFSFSLHTLALSGTTLNPRP